MKKHGADASCFLLFWNVSAENKMKEKHMDILTMWDENEYNITKWGNQIHKEFERTLFCALLLQYG